jgi:hypothetical protein
MPESLSSAEKLERFLTGLARQRDLSANSQNQAFNTISKVLIHRSPPHFLKNFPLGQASSARASHE